MVYRWILAFSVLFPLALACDRPCEVSRIPWKTDFLEVRDEALSSGKSVLLYLTAVQTGDPRAVAVEQRLNQPEMAQILGCHFVHYRVDARSLGKQVPYAGTEIALQEFIETALGENLQAYTDDDNRIVAFDPPAMFVVLSSDMSTKKQSMTLAAQGEDDNAFMNRLQRLQP